MKTALLFVGILAAEAAPGGQWFSGRITYRVVGLNAAGDTLQTSFGMENKFYVWGNSYKMYAAHDRLLELYNGKTKDWQAFGNDGKRVTQADTLPLQVRPVSATGTVLGYPCRAVQEWLLVG